MSCPSVYAHEEIPTDEAVPLTFGDAANGELDEEDYALVVGTYADVYSIHVEEGKTYSITLRSQRFNTYLALMNEDMDYVDGSDDAEGLGTDSRVQYTADTTGTIYIVATSVALEAVGDYTVLAAEVEE